MVVVGDFMLDEQVFGDAERMSPDAPAPVLRVRSRERSPGGAANVCLDLAALGGKVRAVGVVGRDEAGVALRGMLEEAGVDAAGLVEVDDRPTTIKRSLVGLAQHRHPQKMLRMDEESRAPVEGKTAEMLAKAVERALEDGSTLCLEDYGKGVCTQWLCQEVVALARRAGVEALVDPALGAPLERYRGCTALTPNRTEAEALLGVEIDPASTQALEAAAQLLDALEAQAVALTLDRHGAALAARRADGSTATTRLPTRAREVYDVTGAGDMVLAAMAAGRANGLAWEDAARLANIAAGLEVEVFGARPIPLERVHRAALLEERAQGHKLRTLEETLVEVAALRREGKTIVFTNGCFDILHAGHIALLREARAQGDALFVGLNDDDSVRRLKGPGRPVHPLADRAAVLSELRSVDCVTPFAEDTPIPLIQAIRPDVLVKGDEYARSEVVGGELVESWGGRVHLARTLDGRSTSRAVRKLHEAGAFEEPMRKP